MLALCLAPLPALAAPQFLPANDVRVSYALNLPGQAAQDYTLDYDAADRLARVESPAQGIYILANLGQGRAQVVVPALHAIVQAPDFSGLTQMITNAGGARFTPLGRHQYAGLGCEEYLVQSGQGGTATACLTPDGVILHFSGKDGHGAAEVTALSVAFAPQPAGEFAAPSEFAEIALPPGALMALLRPQ